RISESVCMVLQENMENYYKLKPLFMLKTRDILHLQPAGKWITGLGRFLSVILSDVYRKAVNY
ncbi:MAG TPA: hypothetical protein PKE03_12380, partial [Bacteroidales bacterium]|nr:hypothetical protein [Bacteroidales bacterium]